MIARLWGGGCGGRLSAGKRLHDVYGGLVGHGIGQPISVSNRFAVDEDGHVLAKGALIIQHIPSGGVVAFEVCVQDIAQGPSVHVPGWTADMPLNIRCESDLCQTVLPNDALVATS